MPSPLQYKIGNFRFLSLTPVPPESKDRFHVESRSGVDGFSFWDDAKRGQVYRPSTAVDVASHLEAQDLKTSYEGIIRTLVELVYADRTYPDVMVKDVRVRITEVMGSIGGFVSGSRALVRARWNLIIR